MPFRAGMFVHALLFMLGILIVQQLSVLPGKAVLSLLIAALLTALIYRKVSAKSVDYQRKISVIKIYITLSLYFILLILLGFTYAVIRADGALSNRLDESFTGKDIFVSGFVSGIPAISGTVQRFEFTVLNFHLADKDHADNRVHNKSGADQTGALKGPANHPKKIRLSWYYGKKVNAGEQWQLLVRLKPPHGFMNPGGFDYEAWLFQHGIDATGYVRKSASTANSNLRLQAASIWSVDRLRQVISQQLDSLAETVQAAEGKNSYALLRALAVGDKSSISTQQWNTLTATGTSHLMAISGLHIGLASLFAYVLIRRLLPECLMKRLPAQHIALVCGFILAFLYALLAGLSVPTQRAIIMLSAITFMMLFRRNTRPLDTLGFALFLVLLVDPFAVMSAGFWFSFSAVAVIFISLLSHRDPAYESDDNAGDDEVRWWQRFVYIGRQWVRLQLIISVFLLPLSLFMFQQGSLVSPLANLLLIPYVSFLVVPIVLAGIIFNFIHLDTAQLLFSLAALMLDFIWPFLDFLAQLPFSLWVRGNLSLLDVSMATLSITLLYFSQTVSRFLYQRYLAARQADGLTSSAALWCFRLLAMLLLVPMFAPADFNGQLLDKPGEFQITVLDVGQGSSAVIRTSNHLAVFDAGAKFSDKLNVGSGVVVPYLRSQGVERLNRLIISHGDADHIGGAQDLLDAYPESELYGQDIDALSINSRQIKGKNIKGFPAEKHLCVEGMRWHWDGVDFVFWSPAEKADNLPAKHRNNHSCVLRVSSALGSVLFTGDIEAKVERQLVEKYGNDLASDILIVPHHGSNTSSSNNFISAVNSKIALISVAYKNRYRLPSSKVLKRYEDMDIDVLQTADSGAITINYLADNGKNPAVMLYRRESSRYWHHRPVLAYGNSNKWMNSALLKQIE